MSKVAAVLALFEGLPGAQFASFVYTAKGTGEVAKHSVILGASMRNVYEKDIEALSAIRETLSGVEAEACDEIISSRHASLALGIGNNPEYTNADTYVMLPGFPGVKVHKETGEVYVTCLSNGKTVITPGTYKTVNSKPKTLAKNKLLKEHCRGNDIRTYRFTNIARVACRGDVLDIDGEAVVDFQK